MDALRESLIVAFHGLHGAIKSPRAILLLAIYALSAVLTSAAIIWLMSTARVHIDEQVALMAPDMDASEVAAEMSEAYRQVMTLLVGDEERATHLASIPIFALFMFWGTRSFLPWFAVLMGYDLVNRELHDRSARYALLRIGRGSLLAGKVIPVVVMLLVMTAVANLIVLLIAVWAMEDLQALQASRYLFEFWALAVPIGLCWIAFMAFLSSAIRGPYLSLLLGLACLMGTVFIGWIARMFESASGLRWLVPWHYGGMLVSPSGWERLAGIGGFLSFTAVFLALAYLTLKWRDI